MASNKLFACLLNHTARKILKNTRRDNSNNNKKDINHICITKTRQHVILQDILIINHN